MSARSGGLDVLGETAPRGFPIKDWLNYHWTRLLRYKVDFQSMQLDDLPPDTEYDLDDY
uniref:Uncharacterized protein n=1 Tax=Timema poppense TaxID=170557 RepID=A0A7R9DGE2_TIMPO|nr:unnamed protein product [Timema poppensis]